MAKRQLEADTRGVEATIVAGAHSDEHTPGVRADSVEPPETIDEEIAGLIVQLAIKVVLILEKINEANVRLAQQAETLLAPQDPIFFIASIARANALRSQEVEHFISKLTTYFGKVPPNTLKNIVNEIEAFLSTHAATSTTFRELRQLCDQSLRDKPEKDLYSVLIDLEEITQYSGLALLIRTLFTPQEILNCFVQLHNSLKSNSSDPTLKEKYGSFGSVVAKAIHNRINIGEVTYDNPNLSAILGHRDASREWIKYQITNDQANVIGYPMLDDFPELADIILEVVFEHGYDGKGPRALVSLVATWLADHPQATVSVFPDWESSDPPSRLLDEPTDFEIILYAYIRGLDESNIDAKKVWEVLNGLISYRSHNLSTEIGYNLICSRFFSENIHKLHNGNKPLILLRDLAAIEYLSDLALKHRMIAVADLVHLCHAWHIDLAAPDNKTKLPSFFNLLKSGDWLALPTGTDLSQTYAFLLESITLRLQFSITQLTEEELAVIRNYMKYITDLDDLKIMRLLSQVITTHSTTSHPELKTRTFQDFVAYNIRHNQVM